MKIEWGTIETAAENLKNRPDEFAAFLYEAFKYKENILLFAEYCFPHYASIKSPEFHQELIELLDAPGNGGVAAPRGHAKTTMASIVYVAWLCLYEQEPFIMVGSETYSLAVQNVNDLKFELEGNPAIQIIYGEQKSEYWQDGDFVTNKNIRVMAISYGGRIRGIKHKQFRPTFILLDDMENDKNVRSADQRLYMREWLTKAVLPAVAKGGRVKVIGTVLHSDSLLLNIINGVDEFASWEPNSRLFRALNEKDGQEYSLWPELYSVEELKRMRDDPTFEHYKGSLSFSQEMQNEPLSDEDRVIKQEWIDGTQERPLRYSLTEEMAKWEERNPGHEDNKTWLNSHLVQIMAGVDPAISEKTHADYWAMVTIGIDRKGHIYILDIIRTKESDVEKQAQLVIDSFKKWKHDKIKVETVAYQAGLYNLIKKKGAEQGVYPTVWSVKPDRDKRQRAVIHSANFSGGLVHLRTDHENSNVFREELLQFPRGVHDDMFDAYMNAAEDQIKKTRSRVFAKKPQGF